MPVLSVTNNDDGRAIPFTPGLTVREILENADIGLHGACGGSGVCGRCLVRIIEGIANDPTANERSTLSVDRISQGVRLACQVRVRGDTRITIEIPAPHPNWKNLAETDTTPVIPSAHPDSTSALPLHAYGVAMDLGSTQIRISAWDLTTGRRIAGRVGLNPQARFGADVLTRLTAAAESATCAGTMSRLVKTAVREALSGVFAGKDCIGEIEHMLIVGNTAMLALLTEDNYGLLLQPENWMRHIDCRPKHMTAWTLSWGLDSKASVEVVPPLAGFVGSDLMAGVLATGLTRTRAGALLIDFGTNSEIALWDGEHLWITSAAGGPAFEAGIGRCGMPAEPGAIYRIVPGPSSSDFHCEVVGGGKPTGLCGSGLLDIIACLLEARTLTRNGGFSPGVGEEGFPILKGESDILLTHRDVDLFQQAKAAIGAGTQFLMRQAGLGLKDLTRICICGAFGHFMNPMNARNVGLLPGMPDQYIELCGDTALAGCEMLLLAPEAAVLVNSLKEKSRIINLAGLAEFETLFIENLYLQPMQL